MIFSLDILLQMVKRPPPVTYEFILIKLLKIWCKGKPLHFLYLRGISYVNDN